MASINKHPESSWVTSQSFSTGSDTGSPAAHRGHWWSSKWPVYSRDLEPKPRHHFLMPVFPKQESVVRLNWVTPEAFLTVCFKDGFLLNHFVLKFSFTSVSIFLFHVCLQLQWSRVKLQMTTHSRICFTIKDCKCQYNRVLLFCRICRKHNVYSPVTAVKTSVSHTCRALTLTSRLAWPNVSCRWRALRL